MYVCVAVTHSGNLLCEFCRKVKGRMCVCVVAPIPATCCASFVGVSRDVCVCVLVTHSSNLLCEFCRKVMGRMCVCVLAPIPATCCASFVGVSRAVCVCVS